jgi:hypothetical protein
MAPSLQVLHAFASATLRDEGLVIVAARPRVVPPRSGNVRDTKVKGRD